MKSLILFTLLFNLCLANLYLAKEYKNINNSSNQSVDANINVSLGQTQKDTGKKTDTKIMQ